MSPTPLLCNSIAKTVSIQAMKISRSTSAFVALIAFGSLVAAAQSRIQSADFTVSENGHTVGTASYKILPTQTGFSSESLVQVSMQGLNYALSKTERLSPTHELKHVLLSGTINGSAVNIIAKPDAAQLLMNISANGRASTSRLAWHAAAIFLPDFDPGALETLLALDAARNGQNLWAIIPKRSGSVVPLTITTDNPEQGSLNGQPITVRHITAGFSGDKIELFASPKNHLLQAELPQEGFALVHKGFVLTPPKTAPAAPPQQPAAQQQPTPAQPQQPAYPQ